MVDSLTEKILNLVGKLNNYRSYHKSIYTNLLFFPETLSGTYQYLENNMGDIQMFGHLRNRNKCMDELYPDKCHTL